LIVWIIHDLSVYLNYKQIHHMKKIILILLLLPLSVFSQSDEMIDSVNYYFGILLNNERDSVNQHNSSDKSFKKLNMLKVETDKRKFINPTKHINYLVRTISNPKSKTYRPHSTTNFENTLIEFWWSPEEDPKTTAKMFFDTWKKSHGHYILMINGEKWSNSHFDTFKILYKSEINVGKGQYPFLVATYTVF